MTVTSTMRMAVFIVLAFLLQSTNVKAGIPCSHIMICCRENNKGITFLVNGKWNGAHDYSDISQVADVLQKIKDAGINIVIIDMTNESQWNQYWHLFEPMVNNIQQVCKQKNMQFIVFIGAAGDLALWNKKAERIWKLWAQDSSYRRYGFGDNRPMLIAFQPCDMYWERYNSAPDSAKTYLSKFYIGTTQVNDPILPGKTDGWGYRNYSQSVDGKVRFASPDGGVAPGTWFHISKAEWEKRVAWAKEAEQYSVYGSYDDTCDAINWGIADTKSTDVQHNRYPNDEPYVYYDVLKKALTNSTAK